MMLPSLRCFPIRNWLVFDCYCRQIYFSARLRFRLRFGGLAESLIQACDDEGVVEDIADLPVPMPIYIHWFSFARSRNSASTASSMFGDASCAQRYTVLPPAEASVFSAGEFPNKGVRCRATEVQGASLDNEPRKKLEIVS